MKANLHSRLDAQAVGLWGRAFPFFFIVDRALRIVDSGALMRKVCPETGGRPYLADCFASHQFPGESFGLDDLSAPTGQLIVLARLQDRQRVFKGQWLPFDREHLMFLGWPWITSLEQLSEQGLSLHDIPAHNPLGEMLILLQAIHGSLADTRDLAGRLKKHGKTLEQLNRQLSLEIEEHRRADASLAAAKELAEITLESIGDGVIVTDARGIVTNLNAAAAKLTGMQREAVQGKPIEAVFRIADEDANGTNAEPYAAIRQVLSGELTSSHRHNARLQLADGTELEIEYVATIIGYSLGEMAGGVVAFRDVSEARTLTRELAYQAYHDVLTGLPNRLMLRDRLQQAIRLCARGTHKIAVMFIDLDRFKTINDSLGHRFGDGLLREVAVRIGKLVRESDTVSREGGDEFVLLLDQVMSAKHVADVAQKLLESLATPFQIENHTLYIGASIGVSLHPDDGGDADTLIQHADAAMFVAKSSGRNTVRFFTNEIHELVWQRFSLEGELRLAIAERQFTLFYQPQIELASNRITSAEALIRWQHPARGMVPPMDFIPVAEESGLIVPIGEWVLDTACQQIAAWIRQYGWSPAIAVNVSAKQLQMRGFPAQVHELILNSGIPPHLIELELTEHSVMTHHEEASALLQQLKAEGVKLVLDDFGTGYSNLVTLSHLPFDILKIDRTFVTGLPHGRESLALTGMVLALAQQLELEVVAEGVETDEQEELLRSLHCQFVQGYLHSPPIPAGPFADMAFGACRCVD